MDSKILTISIAAYNVERFIHKTLDSLLVPIDLLKKIEVYVIDDGGTDRTLNIAKEYEEKYPGIFYAIHKEDEGYGSTFNYTIEHATGKYFKLLDGDDWFLTKNLIRVLEILEKEDVDIIIDDFYKCKSEDTFDYITAHKMEMSTKILVKDFVSPIPVGMWALFFKTELLKKTKLKLPENMFYVDQLYSTVPFAYAKRILFIKLPLYCYRVGVDGQSASRESRVKYAEQMKKCCYILLEFCEQQKRKNNPNYKYILDRISRYYQTGFRTILLKEINNYNRNELIQFEKHSKSICESVYFKSAKIGKAGLFIKVFRITGYLAYWILKLFKLPNWK